MPNDKPVSAARGVIAERAVLILLLAFGTTSLVQAFVIPTGSTEHTLLVGDHLFVDKLANAPADAFGSMLLPYRDVKRGDIIVFRKTHELEMTLVKRAIGLPDDRIRIVDKRRPLGKGSAPACPDAIWSRRVQPTKVGLSTAVGSGTNLGLMHAEGQLENELGISSMALLESRKLELEVEKLHLSVASERRIQRYELGRP